MAFPVPPVVTFSYTDFEVTYPTTPKPGDELDASFDALVVSNTNIIEYLALIQDEDGSLKNGIVTLETLAPELFDDIVAEIQPSIDDQVASAEAAATTAQTAAANAQTSAINADYFASIAQSGATQAGQSATNAAASANTALNQANLAINAASDAQNADNHATLSANAAALSEQNAYYWAEYLAGPVPSTSYHSARWWANQAAAIVGGGASVLSFGGRTGAVVPAEGDYTLGLLGDVNTAGQLDGHILQRVAGVWVPVDPAAIAAVAGVTSFNGRNGVVTPVEGDYSLGMLSDVDTSGASEGYRLAFVGGTWKPQAPMAGGDVTGPAGATADNIAVYNGTTGKLLKDGAKKISDFSLTGHTHTIANVTGLQTALDGKANSAHTHAQSDVTGLSTALAGKSDRGVLDGMKTVTASGNISVADAGYEILANSGSAIVLTVQPDSVAAWPARSIISVTRLGVGTVTIAPGSGVTIRSVSGYLAIADQYASATLIRIAADEWLLRGSLE
jgi:hypothetical protein